MKKLVLSLLIMVLALPLAFAQTELVIFIGSREDPDLMQSLLDEFNAANPGITARYEIGGDTSELQQQYLNTVLTSKSGDIDLFLVDVVRPAQYAAAEWATPLNQFYSDDTAMMAALEDFLPGPVNADLIDGTLWAMPAYTDAQFLYYRKDLLEKYGFEAPKTWAELKDQALTILAGEGDDTLQGFNYQGAAIEGTVCTFLEPLWTTGSDWRDADGNITIDTPEARQVLEWYADTMASGITKANIAEEKTDDSRVAFQAGDVVFMLNWGYAWSRFQGDEDSQVKDMVGVAPLPAFEGHESATCIGGWQWVINNYSDHKAEAFKLVEFMSSPEVQERLAAEASRIPARKSLYSNENVLAAAPHFGLFYDTILNARPRPVTPYYDDVSQLIRTTMNAYLAGSTNIEGALIDMQIGMEDIFSQ
ncbi:MAG: ABC transporter substrate-binding protein [Trueperaceae bacterium]|nr:ABC transporter substrate-binding protein [Trueperaceae bacterium]